MISALCTLCLNEILILKNVKLNKNFQLIRYFSAFITAKKDFWLDMEKKNISHDEGYPDN